MRSRVQATAVTVSEQAPFRTARNQARTVLRGASTATGARRDPAHTAALISAVPTVSTSYARRNSHPAHSSTHVTVYIRYGHNLSHRLLRTVTVRALARAQARSAPGQLASEQRIAPAAIN